MLQKSRKVLLGQSTSLFYRNCLNHEYRVTFERDGLNVYATTNGAFPAWKMNDEPCESWAKLEKQLPELVQLYNTYEVE